MCSRSSSRSRPHLPTTFISHKRHKEEHRKHKVYSDGESLDVLSEIPSLMVLCSLCSSLCLLWPKRGGRRGAVGIRSDPEQLVRPVRVASAFSETHPRRNVGLRLRLQPSRRPSKPLCAFAGYGL